MNTFSEMLANRIKVTLNTLLICIPCVKGIKLVMNHTYTNWMAIDAFKKHARISQNTPDLYWGCVLKENGKFIAAIDKNGYIHPEKWFRRRVTFGKGQTLLKIFQNQPQVLPKEKYE